jgi:hypothetical protein
MRSRIRRHLRTNAIAYLALFAALGGTAYAASQINGRTIVKESIPGNRLKHNTVKGPQVKESSLKRVPKAKNANTIGGVGKTALGQGIIGGAAFRFSPSASPATYTIQPFGNFDFDSGNAGSDFGVDAIAPVDMRIRDFVGSADSGFSGGESIAFGLAVTPPGGTLNTLALCTVSASQQTCRANGPVAIPKDSTYRLSLGASALSGNEVIGWQFRAAAG